MSNYEWKVYEAPPSASSMIESLRGLGYSPATALADLIDNSISAGSSKVDLTFFWKGEHQYIAVKDNGCGMTSSELLNAMRLGYLNPLSERGKKDLGRFGLGLKTASFSQCRSLTVISKKKGHEPCSLRWDLDYLAADTQSRWKILEEPGKEAANLLPGFVEMEQGTLVVWEKLDRIITAGFSIDDFLELTDSVESHLALTFHRFMQRERPEIVLTINGQKIKARDPFMQNHAATMSTPEDYVQTAGGKICLQGFVLPHKDMLSSQDISEMGDPANWTEHQGFYVYRNSRLLVAGSWLGLGRGRRWSKEEAYKLARIRVDIPNTADSDWKLDIRKSLASPPASVRKRLLLFAESIRNRARHVFAYRGEYKKRSPEGGEVENIWEVCHGKNEVRYHISRKHPAVESLLSADSRIRKSVEALLVLIENTVPVQRIWLDAAEGKDAPRRMTHDSSPSDEMKEILLTVYKNKLMRGNCTPDEVRRQLLLSEPFSEFPELIASLPDTI